MLDRGGAFFKTPRLREPAGVAELVDARDSKSCSLGSMGSIPIAGIFSLSKGYADFGYTANFLVLPIIAP